MNSADAFHGLFGIAAYGGDAAAVVQAWGKRMLRAHPNQTELQRLTFAARPDASWEAVRAPLMEAGRALALPILQDDKDGLPALVRMFARRFQKDEITLEVFLARTDRALKAMVSSADYGELKAAQAELLRIEQNTDPGFNYEAALEALHTRSAAVAEALLTDHEEDTE